MYDKQLKKKVMIAAHRGLCGGNIPCNTVLAYEIALNAGADVMELDISRSADDMLFCFHPGMERIMFEDPTPISVMAGKDVMTRQLMNPDRTLTQFVPPLFDDVLELLKNRCIIAVDKYWMYMPSIAKAIRAHGMQEQVLCKIPNRAEAYQQAAQVAPDLPLLPIVREEAGAPDPLAQKDCRIGGLELIFREDTEYLASEEYAEKIHDRDMLIWINSIVYNYRSILAGGHSDDAAMAGDPDFGWGWLCERGYDIIQTDWVRELYAYLNRP